MAFDPTFGLFGTVTRALKLPEYGVSEKLGGKTGSVERAMQDMNMTSFRPPEPDTSGGTSGTGGTGGTSNYTNLYKPVSNKKTGSGEDLVALAERLERERRAEEERERRRAVKSARDAWNPFFKELDRQESLIPTIKQDYINELNSGYDSQVGVINRGQEAGLNQAEASKGVIRQNQATSLRDLASNLSNAVNAFGQRLGQAGAGDSSAANMANYAYSKLANRNTADVMAQVRNQLAEVETAKQNIVKDAQDKLGALETWKAGEITNINNYVRALQDKIAEKRASGQTAMSQEEASMIRDGFNRAMERVQQINDFAVQSAAEIRQNAQNSLNESTAFINSLLQKNTITPADITQAPIDSGSISSGGTTTLPIPGTLTEEKDKTLSDLLYPLGSYDPNLGY